MFSQNDLSNAYCCALIAAHSMKAEISVDQSCGNVYDVNKLPNHVKLEMTKEISLYTWTSRNKHALLRRPVNPIPVHRQQQKTAMSFLYPPLFSLNELAHFNNLEWERFPSVRGPTNKFLFVMKPIILHVFIEYTECVQFPDNYPLHDCMFGLENKLSKHLFSERATSGFG